MSDQTAQATWSSKYEAKNETAPPPIYEHVNASVLGAQPGEASDSSSKGKFPRLPKESDFPKKIENRIIDNAPNEDIHHIIVVLHGYGADTEQLLEFTKKHLLGPNTACILVRGTNPLLECEGAYCWSDDGESSSRFHAFQARNNRKNKRQQTGLSSIRSSNMPGPSRSNTTRTTGSLEELEVNENEDTGSPPTFASSTEQIGVEVITDVLIKKCGFRARDIALVGHGEGGSAALAVVAACCDTEFGGAVSIGGILPSDFPDGPSGLLPGNRSPTHVLLLGGALGDVNNREVLRIETAFTATTKAQKAGKSDDFNEIEDMRLKEFLAHQLWRAEWTKEAVATFDGGGIRGYGSLLMLRALMLLIAQHEKNLDRLDDHANGPPPPGVRRLADSSFSPCPFPPIETNGMPRERDPKDLEDDQRYLPCHYFTFVGGTSTGGLISIMISRFRMSVHDCLEAYQKLGSKVFGHPRPPDFGVRWHKFDANRLEEVISQVVSRHGEEVAPGEKVSFHFPEALCKTIVAARADRGFETVPFLFRTYDCRTEDSKHPPRNAGAAAQCSIIEVGRATSAAPSFFRPIDIDTWDPRIYNGQSPIPFIDGGFGLNNPSHEILLDIKRKLRSPNGVFDVFVSFGTGVSKEHLQGSLSTWWRLVKEMKKEMTDVLRAHQAMVHECGLDNEGEGAKKAFEYFRFDGGEDLGKVKMDEWSGRRKAQCYLRSRPTGEETLKAMADGVRKYLKSRLVQAELERLAEMLVLRRRLRTRDKSAWETYACASHYKCNQTRCDVKVDTLDEFEVHLDDAHHSLSRDDRHLAIQVSKRCWTYREFPDDD